jgi:uncharacterized membrane protein
MKMDAAMIIARLIHVVGGIFWVGAMIFVTFFLMPSLADAGPDGAKVMQGLMKRKYVQILPVVAILVMLSGLYMFWKLSGGFDHHFPRRARGIRTRREDCSRSSPS